MHGGHMKVVFASFLESLYISFKTVKAMSSPEKAAETEKTPEKQEEEPHGQKRPVEEDLGEKVHSANSWESVDLGDTDRKNKFLRLMGAGKKEHHGRFVIGDHNPSKLRTAEKSEKIANEVEEQYVHGMEHRLQSGPKKHTGLGFEDSEKKEEEKKEEGEKQDESKEGGNKDKSESKDSNEDNAAKSEKKDEGTDSKKFKKMSFVKASS